MKAGTYKNNSIGEANYKSFYPTSLFEFDCTNLDRHTIELLVKANYSLGKLNCLSSQIVDINQFIGSYVRKEALFSSQIEGTQVTLEDILDNSNENNANADIEEAINNVSKKSRTYSYTDYIAILKR